MLEHWDLYRIEDGRFVRTVAKGSEKVPDDLYHEAVEVIPTDKAGHMLITMRSFLKGYGGGRYEFPAGSVMSGESPVQAARRELFEETGLKAAKLQKLGSPITPGLKRYIYLAHIPNLLNTKIQLHATETIAYRIVTYEEWLDLADQNHFDTNRLALYNNTIHNNIQKLVGIPKESAFRKELRLLSPTQDLSGIPAEELLKEKMKPDNTLDDLEVLLILDRTKEEDDEDAEA